jgi:hypothetical protein
MKLCGKDCKDYFRMIWPFMALTFALGVIELLLYKYEILNPRTLNWYFIPQLLLLITLGALTQKKGFNKRQTMMASMFCLLTVVWLPPFLMPSLGIPLIYKLLNYAIMYVTNIVMYAILSLLGWFIGVAITKKSWKKAKPAASKSMAKKATPKRRKR